MPVRRALLLLPLLVACGGAPASEATATLPTMIAPPPPSFVPDDATIVLRFDARTIRETGIAADVSAMIGVSGTWSTLSAGSGADPITDVDVMLCAARASFPGRGIVSSHWYFVLRHPYDPTEIEARVARIGAQHGIPVAWQDDQGLRFADLPLPLGGFAPHFVLVTARHEIVVAPIDDLVRVLGIARAQARVRRGEEAVDPWLATATDEIAFVRVTPGGAPIALLDGVPPMQALELRTSRAAPSISLDLRATYASDAEASGAFDAADVLRRQASDHPLARVFGVSRLLTGARIGIEGSVLRVVATIDEGTARRIARLVMHAQTP